MATLYTPVKKYGNLVFFLPAGPISCSIADQKPGRNTAQGQKTYIAGDALVVIHIDMWRLKFLFKIIRIFHDHFQLPPFLLINYIYSFF